MKRIASVLVISLFVLGLGLSSCGKYEDGPSISFRSKKARLVGTWVVEKIYLNGNEQTLITSSLEIDKDEEYTVKLGTLTVEEGKWNFGDGKETLETLKNGSSTKDVSTILRLTKKEFWATKVDSFGTWEYHYAKQD
jgi:hypothetical protein